MSVYLLGIDVGTSGSKAILIDERGQLVARCIGEYPLHTPQPLWSEQLPEDWWVNASINTAAACAPGLAPPYIEI